MTNPQHEMGTSPRPHEAGRAMHAVDDDGDYLWCVVCERAFRRGRFRQVGGARLCPYAQCTSSSLLFEPWEWTRVRKLNPAYPRVPYEDVRYPYFGPEF